MSDEKVDIKKFAQGFIQPVEWWKAASIGIKIAVVLLAAFIIWKVFFQKNTTVNVGKGGTAIINQTPKRFLIPFVEVYTEHRSGYDDLGYGIRGGLRFEF